MTAERVGAVVIGRNEGERLRTCLESLEGAAAVVYVDSGSTDGSPEAARALGAHVVELGADAPFTAARARNAGYAKLMDAAPGLAFVQFVDGDCELDPNWLETGVKTLEEQPDAAVICGHLRERFPERSIYNRLCQMEWNTPPGDDAACGGNAMMRVEAFEEAGGFNAALVAGEEPELCLRLRKLGWKTVKTRADMATHDAAMLHFGQWWRRNVRAGRAYAEGAWLHRGSKERYYVHETLSNAFWGIALPLAAVLPALFFSSWSFVLLAGYPLLAVRIFRHMRARGFTPSDSLLYAFFCTLGKFPQALGALDFVLHAFRRDAAK